MTSESVNAVVRSTDAPCWKADEMDDTKGLVLDVSFWLTPRKWKWYKLYWQQQRAFAIFLPFMVHGAQRAKTFSEVLDSSRSWSLWQQRPGTISVWVFVEWGQVGFPECASALLRLEYQVPLDWHVSAALIVVIQVTFPWRCNWHVIVLLQL